MRTSVFPIVIGSRGTCLDCLLVVACPRNAGQSMRQTLRRLVNEDGDVVEDGCAFFQRAMSVARELAMPMGFGAMVTMECFYNENPKPAIVDYVMDLYHNSPNHMERVQALGLLADFLMNSKGH